MVHAEPNDRTAEIFTAQNGLAALSKPGIVQMAFVVPDVLEVDDPQATALVADDVPACQVAVDKPQVVQITHGVEEVFPVAGVSAPVSHERWRRTCPEVAIGKNRPPRVCRPLYTLALAR